MNASRSGRPINLSLEALGDRWSPIVIRELLTRSEKWIASNILADRSARPKCSSG